MPTTPTDALTDTELIAAVRRPSIQPGPRRGTRAEQSDEARHAYGQLWARHAGAARNLARQLTRSDADADDLVAEAFARILDILQASGGPDTAFRAYLLTTVRNTFYDKARRDRRVTISGDMAKHDTGVPFDDLVVSALEASMAARAFADLPERWQMVLWHTEIEGAEPSDLAPLLGLTPNGVSALAYRAREGLRQAYLQVHLTSPNGQRCRTTVERLGAWTRKGLARRDARRVEGHLSDCPQCRALADELLDVNSGLRGVIAPLVLGMPFVAGYLGLTAKSASAAAAGATAAVSAGTSAATGSAPASGAGASGAGASGAGASGAGVVEPGAIARLAHLSNVGAGQIAAGAAAAAVVGAVVATLLLGSGDNNTGTIGSPPPGGLTLSAPPSGSAGPGQPTSSTSGRPTATSGVPGIGGSGAQGPQAGANPPGGGLLGPGQFPGTSPISTATGPVGLNPPGQGPPGENPPGQNPPGQSPPGGGTPTGPTTAPTGGPTPTGTAPPTGNPPPTTNPPPTSNPPTHSPPPSTKPPTKSPTKPPAPPPPPILNSPTISVHTLVLGISTGLTVTVHNSGGSTATGVAVDLSLPTGVLAQPSGGCSGGGRSATCSVGSLKAGASASIRLPVLASALGNGLVGVTAHDSGGQSAHSSAALPVVGSLPIL